MQQMIEFIRALPRPFMAITAVAGTLALILSHTPIPEGWWALVGSVATFYLIHRHEEKKTNGQ